MQENLYPNLISITMLDGIKDDLEFRILLNNNLDHNLMYSSSAVQLNEPLLESQHLWIIAGISLAAIGIIAENKRRRKAKQILNQLISKNMWD